MERIKNIEEMNDYAKPTTYYLSKKQENQLREIGRKVPALVNDKTESLARDMLDSHLKFFKKAIYILGGMGPQASLEFHKLLIDNARKLYGAMNNDDFPEFVIHSLPVSDFINGVGQSSPALKMINRVISSIDAEHFGAYALACNTAHILATNFTSASIPFVSIVEAVVDQIKKDGRIKSDCWQVRQQ